jgi:hypothetical protein
LIKRRRRREEEAKAELAHFQDEVSELKAQVKSLVTQVQLLRNEFGQAFGVVQKQD